MLTHRNSGNDQSLHIDEVTDVFRHPYDVRHLRGLVPVWAVCSDEGG